MPHTTFPLFKLPWSGAVTQDLLDHWFSPTITYNFAGNAPVEKQVVENVASFGRQIGWLNEVVLALAGGGELPEKTLARMHEASNQIKKIKDIHAAGAYANARDALDRLKQEAPETYRRLIDDLNLEHMAEQSDAKRARSGRTSSPSQTPPDKAH
jgi:hypothetical protein